MLSLEPPFHVIKGVCLFRDHADPLQWYAMPGAPRFTTVVETIGDETRHIPQLQLIRFTGEAGTGGFVNFDVDLGIESVRADIEAEIKNIEGLDGTPRIGSLPVVDGSVRMMLFDAATGVPPAGENPPRPEDAALKFVLKLNHPAKPALYGDQRAVFSVQLTQEGVTVFEKAMAGELSPIGVVYQLDYLGLRQAYHVSANVDWDRVQKHIEDHESFKLPLIYSSTIDKVVDELIESRVIEIKVDSFDVETGDSAVTARMDEAVNDIKDMITDTFFEPSVDPIDRSEGDGDTIGSVARVIRAVGSGGMSEFKAFTRRKLDISLTDKKRLDVYMSERSTVKRSIYPQGHLSGLWRLLQSPGIDMSRFVIDVDLDAPYFQRREVEVISRVEFDTDTIDSVSVELDYQGKLQSVLLTKENLKQTVSWTSVLRDGGMVRDVTVRYTVNFGNVDGSERPKTLVSKPEIMKADKLEIDPQRDLYRMDQVAVEASLFPWDRYPIVEVELRYDDAANEIAQSDVVVLEKDKAAQSWSRFVRNHDLATFKYRVTYRAADLQDRHDEWVETDRDEIGIRDPLGRVLKFDIVPTINWMLTERVFIDLSYTDSANEIFEEAAFEFNELAKQTQQFLVRRKSVDRQPLEYQVTVIMKSSEVITVPRSETFDNRIIVRQDMRGHRVIQVRPAAVDFQALKIKKVTVDLLYEDTDHGLHIAKSLTFTSETDLDTFEYDFVDASRQDYKFRFRATFTNNLSKEKSWATSGENPRVIDVG
ncbi:hypothetical protein [Rhodococcus koreensis]